jgi:hypothetical protein
VGRGTSLPSTGEGSDCTGETTCWRGPDGHRPHAAAQDAGAPAHGRKRGADTEQTGRPAQSKTAAAASVEPCREDGSSAGSEPGRPPDKERRRPPPRTASAAPCLAAEKEWLWRERNVVHFRRKR